MFTIDILKNCLSMPYEVFGKKAATFDSVDSVFDAKPNSLSWINSSLKNIDLILSNCSASVIICDSQTKPFFRKLKNITFIVVQNPAVAFLRIVKYLYKSDIVRDKTFIHPSAIVDLDANLGVNVYVGPFAQIGKCKIGDNSIVESYTKIGDDVEIGSHVLISEHCNIGGQGFGHIKNEKGILENMLHIGKVVIEDYVEIFPYSNVDRATLSTTLIKQHSKIDHYCHIGHNASVGEHTVITAKVVLCGGSSVGNYSWIGVGSIIKDKVMIGNQVVLGMGSCVTKNVPDNEIWFGSPAKRYIKP
jgi:UDP-3-O-[3-hydroxymyristoyl] glucosamine N-acyltransferase